MSVLPISKAVLEERVDVRLLAAILEKLTAIEAKLSAPDPTPPPEVPLAGRLALRLEEIADALGVSRRALDRERSAGRFPAPDRVIGSKTPVSAVATVEAWLREGSSK